MCEKHGPIKSNRDELFDTIMPKDSKATASQRRQEQTVKNHQKN
jgi:hypothetical protein